MIITDDKDHAANLFSDINREYLIQSNNEFTDFWIFSNAKNLIIANSSFSYWGARLNLLRDLNVVCPLKWYRNQSISSPFLPINWNLI